MPADCPWCAADGRDGCPEHADGSLFVALFSAVTIEAVLLLIILLVLVIR